MLYKYSYLLTYNFREPYHNKALIVKTADVNDIDFLVRNIHRNLLTETV